MAKTSGPSPAEEESRAGARMVAAWNSEDRPLRLLNWVGYGLLLFFLFDVVEIFSAARLMNPVWELETIGKLTERVAVPLIGFGLAFVGGLKQRSEVEVSWVKFLSWVTLLAAIICWLSVVLGVVNTVRLHRAINQGVSTRLEQQTEQAQVQVKVVKERLDNVSSPDDLKAFLNQFNLKGQAQEVEDTQQVAPIKKQISALLDNRLNNLPVQAKEAQQKQQETLLKRSVKWNLTSLISGALFFTFWRGTRSARQYR